MALFLSAYSPIFNSLILIMVTEINVNEINERIENIHRYLNKHKEYLNGLNVFPVPDGDTGLTWC